MEDFHEKKADANKKLWKHVCIICNFMVKHMTDPRIFKNDHVKGKVYTGAMTEDIANPIKPTI